MNDVNVFLEHHGVKGQKWGVRQKRLDRINRVASGTDLRNKRKNNAIKTVHRVNTGLKITMGALFVGSLISKLHDGPRINNRDSNWFLKNPKKIDPNVIRYNEAQKNGAYQITQWLKNHGGDVI